VSGEPAAEDSGAWSQAPGGDARASERETAAGEREPGASRPGPHAVAGQGPEASDQPSEEELREAYEAELSRITSAEMVLQAAVSLLNIGGYRLGLAGGGGRAPGQERDLDQVRDAIDGVRGLLPVLERTMPAELGPLRDALARLQMAYAREAGAAAKMPSRADPGHAGEPPAGTGAADEPPAGAGADEGNAAPVPGQAGEQDKERSKGPAEASGRLWVPGR
jgi:hypothetical protein